VAIAVEMQNIKEFMSSLLKLQNFLNLLWKSTFSPQI